MKFNRYVWRGGIYNVDAVYLPLQENVCHIGGVCYADGFVNTDDAEQACRPLISTTAWTRIRGNDKSKVVLTAKT